MSNKTKIYIYIYIPSISVKLQNIWQIKPVFKTTQKGIGTGNAK